MKASDSARLRAESSLRQELESRWQQLHERDEERMQAWRGHCQVHRVAGPAAGGALGPSWGRSQAASARQQEECHLLEQCRGLDKAVVQLTEFVQQNQASLNRVLLAEQKAWWVPEWGLRRGEGKALAPCPRHPEPSRAPWGREAAL